MIFPQIQSVRSGLIDVNSKSTLGLAPIGIFIIPNIAVIEHSNNVIASLLSEGEKFFSLMSLEHHAMHCIGAIVDH